MYIPQDSPLVLHLPDLLAAGVQPVTSPHACAEDQSLFTEKEYLGEKIISYLLAIILFIIILSFYLRKIIIQN